MSNLADLDTRLDELDRLEWWDVARRVNPRITWTEFLRQWDEFQCRKTAHATLAHLT